MREGPCADLVERSAASEKSMHSTIVLLMRSSPTIRSEGLGGRVEARMLGILRERERERWPTCWASSVIILGWRTCPVRADSTEVELALDAKSVKDAESTKEAVDRNPPA